MFLPITINIRDKKILIVGGGKVAFEKIRLLRCFTNSITIITKEASNEVRDYMFPIIYKLYEKNDLNNFFLVYACTNDPEINRQIKDDCEEKGILVNVADNPRLCSFLSPAIYKKNNMTVSISSNGENVRKSIKWRNKIKTFLEKKKS